MTNIIPQEFEAVLLTSQRYKSGQNFSPTDIWKQITSINKLQSRPYMTNEPTVKAYLNEAVKSYYLALEVYNKRGAFKASDITRAFVKAQGLIQDAFTAYAAAKQIPATNTNAINTAPDVLTTAAEVNNFLSPYYGDISNKVQRFVRFVEKTDTMPLIYADGIASGSVRPAQFGNGWEAWVSFKNDPWTIWIIGRTGNAFNTDKDIIDYVRQYLPNTRYMGNNILFAREISNWIDQLKSGKLAPANVAAPATPALASPTLPAPGPATASFSPVKKNLAYNDYHALAQKASAADLIITRLEKIAANIISIIKADLTAVSYSALSIAIRTFIGLSNQLSNLFNRLQGEYHYEGDPSKYNFLITQLQSATSDIGNIFSKDNPDRKLVAKKQEEIGKYIQQIILISKSEYDAYQENMRAKYFLAPTPTSKADAGVVIKAYAKGILRAAIEIIAWTGINFIILGFDAVYAGISRLLKLFKQLWLKLRLAMIENKIGSDSNHDKLELYRFQEIQDDLESSIDDLEKYHEGVYTNDFWKHFQDYARKLGQIMGRAKQLIDEDILNDDSNLDYFDRYIRSYKSSIIRMSFQKVEQFIANLFSLGKSVIDYLIDSGVVPVLAKFVLKLLIAIARILNQLVAAGLDLADDLLMDEDIQTHTDHIIDILQRFAPDEVIDKETLANLKEMFDPVFEKIKYVYSHPKIVAEKIKERLGVNNQSQGGMIYRNGGTVSQSGVVSLAERYGHRATASYNDEPLMDSNKLIDESGIGNADNAFGYTPSPVAL